MLQRRGRRASLRPNDARWKISAPGKVPAHAGTGLRSPPGTGKYLLQTLKAVVTLIIPKTRTLKHPHHLRG